MSPDQHPRVMTYRDCVRKALLRGGGTAPDIAEYCRLHPTHNAESASLVLMLHSLELDGEAFFDGEEWHAGPGILIPVEFKKKHAPRPKPEPKPILSEHAPAIAKMAFQRPCFICDRTRACRHRELTVELVIFRMNVESGVPV